jgi:hypothetical protein
MILPYKPEFMGAKCYLRQRFHPVFTQNHQIHQNPPTPDIKNKQKIGKSTIDFLRSNE